MFGALLSLVALLTSHSGAIALTTPAPIVERTAIPRDRRPNFSPFLFLLGTWNCSIASSRRPQTFPARSTTALSSDGYWLVTTTTTPPVPWNRITITAHDYVTYDPTRALWVDLTMDDYGLYGVSTSAGWKAGTLVWNDVLFPKSHATAIHLPNVVSKTGDRSTSSVQRFKEPSAQGFAVTTTCTKTS